MGQRIKNKLIDNRYIFLGFLVPGLIMWFVMYTMQMAPFGDYSLLISDCNVQYVDRVTGFRNLFFQGKSLWYSWSQIQGSNPLNFLGLDPFYFLYLLVSDNHVVDMITIVVIIKLACAGGSFAFYLKKAFKHNELSISFFAWCYALMGYAVCYHFLLDFANAIIVLPFILYGVEKLLDDKGKPYYFTIILALSFTMNYYTSYMSGIYAFLYFIYRYSTTHRHVDGKDFLKKGIRFLISPLIAFGCSAFVLIPCFATVSGRDNLFNGANFGVSLRYQFMDLFSKLFVGSLDTILPDGIPYIYCGVIILILMGFYFLSSVVTYREKILSFSLLAFLMVSLTFNPLYVAWHGFKPPVYFEGRFSYLISCTMILIGYQGYYRFNTVNRTQINKIFIVLTLAFLVVDKKSFTFLKDTNWIYTILFIAVYYLVVMLMKQGNYPRRQLQFLMALFIGAELLSNTSLIMKNLDELMGQFEGSSGYPLKTEYSEPTRQMRDIWRQVQTKDAGVYHMDFVKKRGMNDGFGIGFPGISHFDSIYNYEVKETIGALGMAIGHNWIQYEGSTPIVDTLLNMKYVVSPEKAYFGYQNIDEKDENYIMENPYIISVGFMVKDPITDYDNTLNAIELQEAVLNKMAGEKEKYFVEAPIIHQEITENVKKDLVMTKEDEESKEVDESEMKTSSKNNSESKIEERVNEWQEQTSVLTDNSSAKNISENQRDAGILYTATDDGNAVLSYQVKMKRSGPCYMSVIGENSNQFDVMVNGKILNRNSLESEKPIYLGDFKTNEVIRVKLRIQHKQIFIKEVKFRQPTEKIGEVLEKLKANALNVTEHTETMLKGTLTVSEDKPYLYTSIPYDEGWQLYVDGKPVKTMKVLKAFVGAKLEAGQHEIQLIYKMKGLKTGTITSMVTWAGLLLFILIDKKKHKMQVVRLQKK